MTYSVRLAILVLLVPGAARSQSAQPLIDRIDSLYHATPHWQVTFEQVVRYPVFDETERESGALTVGPDGRFRLATDRHVVVSDGDTIWTHNIRANQVTVDRVDRAGEVVRPADFLLHFEEDYEAQICEHEGPGQCLYLKATDETSFIREMWLWADAETAHVKKATYRDINLNETTFSFSRINFRYKPKAGDFSYEPPPGVEVVRMP
jgi:outer membrane lipoprotein-sorting protein